MNYVLIGLQLFVALSIYNVWLINYNKPSRWRGDHAKNLKEEFKVYGLPNWSLYIIGASKVILASLLIAAIWFPGLLQPSALGLAALLFGSVLMHFKIRDPLFKSFPAFLFLVICLFLAFHEKLI